MYSSVYRDGFLEVPNNLSPGEYTIQLTMPPNNFRLKAKVKLVNEISLGYQINAREVTISWKTKRPTINNAILIDGVILKGCEISFNELASALNNTYLNVEGK